MSAKVYDAINEQVNNELAASHSYLAMAGVCEELNFPGAAHWFRSRVKRNGARAASVRLHSCPQLRRVTVQDPVETTRATTLLEVLPGLAGAGRAGQPADRRALRSRHAREGLRGRGADAVVRDRAGRGGEVGARHHRQAGDGGHDARALLEIDRELGARAGAGGAAAGGRRASKVGPAVPAGRHPVFLTRTPAPWAGATSAAAPCR